MKPASVLLAAFAILLFLPPYTVIAKNASMGIFATVDRVTSEPNERSPNVSASRECSSCPLSVFEWRLQLSERIGYNSSDLLEQARWSRLASIGCRIRVIRKVIHTIRSN
jgi:hypothetical protein